MVGKRKRDVCVSVTRKPRSMQLMFSLSFFFSEMRDEDEKGDIWNLNVTTGEKWPFVERLR